MTDLRDHKPLWGIGEVLRLAWPASLTMLSTTMMQFVDGLMVSRLGPRTFAAQNVGGLMSFVPVSFALGVLMVVNTYVSQNLGAGRTHRCGEYAWAGVFLGWGFAAVIAPTALAAPALFRLFPHEPEIRSQAAMYFSYMVLGTFPELTARSLEQFFFGIGRPRVVFASTLLANGLNVVGDYALIFGRLGMPRLGLQGAAIATVAGQVVQMLVLSGAFLARRTDERFGTRRPRRARRSQCADLLRIGWPAGVQFCNDVFTWAMFTNYLVGRFGTAHLAANVAATRFLSLSFMPTVGAGIATTALVGRYVGQGRPDLARRRAHAALLAAMAYMGACGVAFSLFGRAMVRLFVRVPDALAAGPALLAACGAGEALSPTAGLHLAARALASGVADPLATLLLTSQIARIGGYIMLCAAAYQLVDAMGIIFTGALRGAGDTRWPMLATILLSWSVCVGGGIAAVGVAPQLTSIGPWLAAAAYVLALGAVLGWRFESGRWRRIDLLGPLAARPASLPAAPAGTPIAAQAPPPTQESP